MGTAKPDAAIELDEGILDAASGTPATVNDKATQKVLDLIGRAESSNNYNLSFGWKGHVPVTNMSIDEVLDHQDNVRRLGSPSTAIGKYQFLQKTLKRLKTELGLSGDEKMTPELQDRMAIHLMRNRGLDRFLRGEMDQPQFINRLAMEWAGLPTTAGQSYYHGDGLNKANVPLEALETAIAELTSRAYAESD